MIEYKDIKSIPFHDILHPYISDFSLVANRIDSQLLEHLKAKLSYHILLNLSEFAEVALQKKLDEFLKENNQVFDGWKIFSERMPNYLRIELPVLHHLLKAKVVASTDSINNIIQRFYGDYEQLSKSLLRGNKNTTIVDIDLNMGDDHDGDSTALIHLSSGTKLIYKPRNISLTKGYNAFIKWTNSRLGINLKTFQILDCGSYGWLEFIPKKECCSIDELKEFYYKAGVLLAITYLLGSKDYHYENVIAFGKDPVIIDHETIIQPTFLRISSQLHTMPYYLKNPSVLESQLITIPDAKIPLGVAGFGSKYSTYLTRLEKKVVNANTLKSKRVSKYLEDSLIEKNVPHYKGTPMFINTYSDQFIKGFEQAYDLFYKSKSALKSHASPVTNFYDKEVRFLWRPTSIYYKIINHLRNVTYMSSRENFESKIYEVLSKAYRNERMSKYEFLLKIEQKQLMKGCIPTFTLNSSDKHLLGTEKKQNIFQYSCIENIFKRIDILSSSDKKMQLKFISHSLQGKKIDSKLSIPATTSP